MKVFEVRLRKWYAFAVNADTKEKAKSIIEDMDLYDMEEWQNGERWDIEEIPTHQHNEYKICNIQIDDA